MGFTTTGHGVFNNEGELRMNFEIFISVFGMDMI